MAQARLYRMFFSVSSVILLTLLGPQSRLGAKVLEIGAVCSQNETAVLKGLEGGLTLVTGDGPLFVVPCIAVLTASSHL